MLSDFDTAFVNLCNRVFKLIIERGQGLNNVFDIFYNSHFNLIYHRKKCNKTCAMDVFCKFAVDTSSLNCNVIDVHKTIAGITNQKKNNSHSQFTSMHALTPKIPKIYGPHNVLVRAPFAWTMDNNKLRCVAVRSVDKLIFHREFIMSAMY